MSPAVLVPSAVPATLNFAALACDCGRGGGVGRGGNIITPFGVTLLLVFFVVVLVVLFFVVSC